MSADRVALRYSHALIEALSEKNALDQADKFIEFCDVVADNGELSGLLKNVTVSAEAKGKVTAAVAEKLALPEMTRNFLRVLANNGRMGILGDVRAAVAAGLDEVRNIQAVQLTTATEPSAANREAFAKAMETKLGSSVRVELKTDPSILGGAIAQVGSFVYDGSVRAQLKRLRNELIKEN